MYQQEVAVVQDGPDKQLLIVDQAMAQSRASHVICGRELLDLLVPLPISFQTFSVRESAQYGASNRDH